MHLIFRFFKELIACLLAGILGMPLGVIQFMPVYHPLHDSNNIHTEVCVFIQMSVYVMITWAGDRKAAVKRHELVEREKTKKSKGLQAVKFYVCTLLHYAEPMTLVSCARLPGS